MTIEIQKDKDIRKGYVTKPNRQRFDSTGQLARKVKGETKKRANDNAERKCQSGVSTVFDCTHRQLQHTTQ